MIERVVVLGAGAVGGTIAALLDSLSVPVVLIARGAHGAALRESGLTLRMPDRVLRRRILVAALPAEVDWQPSDLCLLSTKLQDAEAALEQVLAAAGPKLPIACAVNGLHGERWAASRFETVLSTLVWVVATHLVPGEVRLYSSRRLGVLDSGPTQGDPDGALTREFCGLLERAGFEARVRTDIARWKATKLLLNLGGAAQALVTDDWQGVAKRAREEGGRVLEQAGIDFVPLPEFMTRIETVPMEEIEGEARGGGSTWQSFQRGQPLESPWLEGALADLAQANGLEAPINRALARCALEAKPVQASEVLSADRQ